MTDNGNYAVWNPSTSLPIIVAERPARDSLKVGDWFNPIFSSIHLRSLNSPWDTGNQYGAFQHPILDIVPRAHTIGYREDAVESRISTLAGYGGYKKEDIIAVPINKTGIFISKAWDIRDKVSNFLQSNEASSLHKFMTGKGYSLRDISGFASGFIPKDAIAAIGPDNTFYSCRDFFDKVKRTAATHNVKTEDTIKYVILHEFMHLYGVHSEEEVEKLVEEFAKQLADKEFAGYATSVPRSESSGSGWASKKQEYKRIAKIAKNRQGNGSLLSALKEIDIDYLVEAFGDKEAYSRLSKEEAKEYANAISKKLENGDNKNNKKEGKNTEDRNPENLEGIVENSSEAEGEAATESGNSSDSGE